MKRGEDVTTTELKPVHAGFIPLVDAAILIAAREKGFAAEEGIDLTLVKETSWANIRDRMAIGHFDVAHMLAPMPLAAALGLMPLPLKIVAPMALGIGGNAITLSTPLFDEMAALSPMDSMDAVQTGDGLRRLIDSRKSNGEAPLVFGVVHPYSGHNYELRYWLAASGIDPETDVEIVIVPPPLMADALKSGMLDGFCVGEPWNSVAVDLGVGRTLTTKSRIWRNSPEKVLGVSEKFQQQNPDLLSALIRALYKAAQWSGDPTNIPALAALLSSTNYIDVSSNLLERSLRGQMDATQTPDPDFFIPFAKAATFPWHSHGLWFYSQMVRWGHVKWSPDHISAVTGCYRPDLYRKALGDLASSIPSANAKVEGALKQPVHVGTTKGELLLGPDGFFDGEIFDPDHLHAYLKAQGAEV